MSSIIDECLALYGSDAYFVRYPAREAEVEYWDEKRDPDGNIRDLAAERDQRKADLAYIADAVNARAAGRVVDVGCGLGELLEQISPKHERVGVDPSERAVEVAAERSGARTLRGELSVDLFPAGSCDTIIAHHVIEHIEEPVGFVETVRHLLAPGGVFVVGTPNFASAAARRFGERFRLLHDPTHVSLFTDDSLLRLLRDFGFRVAAVEYPFFGTRFATDEAWARMLDAEKGVSPAFWGSFVTVFAEKTS
ncbi:class I SAM-dependent methyltransferase [Stappia stellulata]|uniref:class I SAM-dependent methyltransferase n=1 Tax=Stappia stellulata TaxID=71235 RepID=UPI001CD7B44D|nr:class I SAM-dependent methyltransferase [Stappia stellulata]MCA1243838.1 class I SAM-dependent methyltransferase [Stappia stellulata]